MNHRTAIEIVSTELGITVTAKDDLIQKQRLATRINEILKHDFEKLVHILYRIDVNEAKLRSILEQYPDTDAGILIAGLMIERQEQKIQARQTFKPKNENIDDDEKW